MSIKTFPQVVFISVVNPGTPDEFLSASLNTTEALGDENSQIVGIYKFVGSHELASRPPWLGVKRHSKKTT